MNRLPRIGDVKVNINLIDKPPLEMGYKEYGRLYYDEDLTNNRRAKYMGFFELRAKNALLGPYKGYYGSCEPQPADNCVCGKLLGIKDVICYSAISKFDIHQSFRDAVDDYLLVCKKLGDKPNTPQNK